MVNKYKKILIIIVILFVCVSIIGVSYALFDKNGDNNISLVLTDENLSINYLDGKEYNLKNVTNGNSYVKKVSVSNENSSDTHITISLMDVEKSNDNFSLVVLDSSNNIIYDKKISAIDTEIIKGVTLEGKKTVSYTFMVKYDGEESTNFFADILVYRDSLIKEQLNFADTILKNTKKASVSTKAGEAIANEYEGLIKSFDDLGTAYYFRGNVDNNYVKIGDNLFRIVRINGDNSVRLVLDNVLTSLSEYNDNVDEVEDYTSKLLFDNSKIKVSLENWINSLGESKKYIVDSVFCEDTTVLSEENSIKYLNPYNRIFLDNNPTLTCLGEKKERQVGLLTADEVTLAGAAKKQKNNSYYLYNSDINNAWWTMSGSQIIEGSNVVDVISINQDGSLDYEKKIGTQLGVRPVISIDKDVSVTGNGTKDNPYMLQ